MKTITSSYTSTTCIYHRAVLVLGLLCLLNSINVAAKENRISIELNKLEQNDQACRAYLVLENTDIEFKSLKLDLVMFDQEGIVAKRLAVETAPLPKNKTSLKVFDINATPCNDVSRILLNNILSCQDKESERQDCLTLIETRHRGDVPFLK